MAWYDYAAKGAGTVAGGVGSAVGSGIDVLSGGGKTDVGRYDEWQEDEMQRQRDLQAQVRGDQEWLQEQYRQRIAGASPSVAERQLAETTARNQMQQMAMARSGGGGALGRGAAEYAAARNAAMQSQQAAGKAATLRAQEQMAAEQNLGTLVGQERGQDQAQFQGELDWEGVKAGSYDRWADAQTRAEEAYKGRKGKVIGGLISGAGSALGMAGKK